MTSPHIVSIETCLTPSRAVFRWLSTQKKRVVAIYLLWTSVTSRTKTATTIGMRKFRKKNPPGIPRHFVLFCRDLQLLLQLIHFRRLRWLQHLGGGAPSALLESWRCGFWSENGQQNTGKWCKKNENQDVMMQHLYATTFISDYSDYSTLKCDAIRTTTHHFFYIHQQIQKLLILILSRNCLSSRRNPQLKRH